jgi:TM2 domain-containing membrane protein YozV
VGEWFYIGQFGQLGPLTLEQVEELISVGVVTPETYVWKDGLPNWVRASEAVELAPLLRSSVREVTPPPPPPDWNSGDVPPVSSAAPPGQTFTKLGYSVQDAPASGPVAVGYDMGGFAHPTAYATPVSDRSRVLAGVLQMLIPGVGRMYLGYAAIGVLQLLLAMCVVGYIWSFIDGVMMLIGTVKMDGYGRKLSD